MFPLWNQTLFQNLSAGARSRREGAIPPELGQLRALEHLYLDHNQLDGEKPDIKRNPRGGGGEGGKG